MTKTTRRSYHSDFKLAVKLDYISKEDLVGLPRSTLHRFKSYDQTLLVGADRSASRDDFNLLKEIADSKAALSAARAVLRVASFVRSLGLPFHDIANCKLPEVRRSVVAFVERIKVVLPFSKILKLLGLSYARFRAWVKNSKPCLSSPLDRCRKTYPHQLTQSELRAIAKAFRDPVHARWPASSIAWRLIHSGEVCAHVSTITRYARRLGLYHTLLHHRSRKRGSLSASIPNLAWHMDATIVTMQNNQKAYLQLLLDNVSHKILALKDSISVSALNSTALLRTAFSSLSASPEEDIRLIVDGGPENNNKSVEAYLDTVPITKLIARVDVSFSNSMIEAVNKILKYRYLFRTPTPDLEHLHDAASTAIEDYNNRPHYALHGLTPNQAYCGAVFDKATYHARLLEAQRRRRLANRLGLSALQATEPGRRGRSMMKDIQMPFVTASRLDNPSFVSQRPSCIVAEVTA